MWFLTLTYQIIKSFYFKKNLIVISWFICSIIMDKLYFFRSIKLFYWISDFLPHPIFLWAATLPLFLKYLTLPYYVPNLIAGFRIRDFSKSGSEGLYLKRRDIFKRLWNEYFRYYQKTPFLFLYFWCQMSPVSARAPDPGKIQTGDVRQQKYKNKKGVFW